jgi:hypothetical protein
MVMTMPTLKTGRSCPGCGYCSIPTADEWGGMCAQCWANLDDGERAVISGDPGPQRVVTYTLPARPGLASRIVVSALSSSIGTLGALAAAKYLMHWM